jgi:hypothetical protein
MTHSGGGVLGARAMLEEPNVEGSSAKKTKRKPVDLELEVYANHDLLAKPGWETVREPWSATTAMEFIKLPHLDRWWPEELHFKHCTARVVTYTHIKDMHVKWRFLEILRAISNMERWPKNNIPIAIATLMYAEYQLGRRVDWSSINKDYYSGRKLGHVLLAKKPTEIPKNAIPQWFHDNPRLYDDPDQPLPVDRETPKFYERLRDRKAKAAKALQKREVTQSTKLGIHIRNEIDKESMPLSSTMEVTNGTQSKAFKVSAICTPHSTINELGMDSRKAGGRHELFQPIEAIERTRPILGIGDLEAQGDPSCRDICVEFRTQIEALQLENRTLQRDRADVVEMALKGRALELENLNFRAEIAQFRNQLNQLNSRNENYGVEVAALKRELQEVRAQNITDKTTRIDLLSELNELRVYRANEESARDKLKLAVSKIIDEREEMMLAMLFAVARARQYQAEFKSICAEWTSEKKLRTLLLTSWPRDETMYPISWDEMDSLVKPDNNSIDWKLITEDDHRWNNEEVHDHPIDMIGKPLWQRPHPMTSDGSSCPICENPWGPEGCFTIGSCGHSFHPHCLIKSMIRSRTCAMCRAPLHPRLYLQFGLRDFMPTHWTYRQDDYDFILEDFNGHPVEWNWRHNMSKAQLWHTFGGEGLLDDPDKLMHAANEMYPDKPADYGMKMFFYQTMGWHLDRQMKDLVHGLGPPPYYNSSGQRAVGDLELRRAYRDTTLAGSTGTEDLYWEERYHQKQLLLTALDAILDDVAPEVKEWLNGGDIPRYRELVNRHGRHGYRTRSNVRAENGAS